MTRILRFANYGKPRVGFGLVYAGHDDPTVIGISFTFGRKVWRLYLRSFR